MKNMLSTRLWPAFVMCFAALLIVLSCWKLATLSGDVRSERLMLGDTPATVYRLNGNSDAPLVMVAHGFAGSRQMMSAVSLTLARAGFAVVAFDFIGHGRHTGLMSSDVGRIEGTTSHLVTQTRDVVKAARLLPGVDRAEPVALVGHSMATDIVVRAAEAMPDTAAIVAISMYSDAVTPGFPERLLVISGAWEQRLREVALRFVRMVDAKSDEGETAQRGPVMRRAVAAPDVEHVGVLYSATTLAETRDWVAAAMGRDVAGTPESGLATIGPWMLLLLLGTFLAFGPLSCLAGPVGSVAPVPRRVFLLAVTAPVLPTLGATVLLANVGSVAGFVPLTAFLGVWGLIQLAVLWRHGWRPERPDGRALALLVVWGLVFALMLDRVFAAFMPTGPRLPLMAGLLVGALPFGLADAVLATGAPLWRRVVARVVVLAVLVGAIMAAPTPLGLIFTVLPVLILFWLVYGTFGRWVGTRAGATTAGIGGALALAWSIAASTPLFALP